MTAFLVTYTTRSGRKRELTLEASNPAMARRMLRQRGILSNTLVRRQDAGAPKAEARSSEPSGWLQWLSLEPGISVRTKALFANKLSALIDAGVPILRSLDLMRTQERSSKLRRALRGMAQDVNQGDSLGNAMRRWPQAFANLSIAMVEAGEAGGVLDETLRHLAKLLEDNAKLQNQIRGALGYPVTVLVIAVAVFLGMTIFFITVFAGIFV